MCYRSTVVVLGALCSARHFQVFRVLQKVLELTYPGRSHTVHTKRNSFNVTKTIPS